MALQHPPAPVSQPPAHGLLPMVANMATGRHLGCKNYTGDQPHTWLKNH